MKHLVIALLFLSPLSAAATEHASKPSIEQLSWMTGAWIGPIGNQTLEEKWSEPKNGSIGAFVRFFGETDTSTIELIVISEMDETLVLNLQQWNLAMEPRSDKGMQRMVLDTLGEQSVRFVADSEGGLSALTYALNDAGQFLVTVELVEGNTLNIVLDPMDEAAAIAEARRKLAGQAE